MSLLAREGIRGMDDRGNGEWKNREGEYEGGKVRGGEGERESMV